MARIPTAARSRLRRRSEPPGVASILRTPRVESTLSPALRDAWAVFIARLDRLYGFDWFTTNTFRNDRLAPEAQERLWKRWIHEINRKVFGLRYTKRGQGVVWVRCWEPHRLRNVGHFHALVGGGVGMLDRAVWAKRWEHHAGFAQIRPYDSSKGARFYLAKQYPLGAEIDPWVPRQPCLRNLVAPRSR